MGITIAGWQHQLLENLRMEGIAAGFNAEGNALLLKFEERSNLILHLISAEGFPSLQESMTLQHAQRAKGVLLVQMWEDIWHSRPGQVLSRIRSLLGRNQTLHGRKTKLISVTQPQADEFFDLYHLQGPAASRYKYALTIGDEIVAMASFSAKRKMTRRALPGYTSVELIRFATKDGYTVQGGLSKLIKHLVKTLAPDDVMTYTDLDWSYGDGYTKLGFECVAISAPAEIWLHTGTMTRLFPHRLPEELKFAISMMSPPEAEAYLREMSYLRIYNTGNHKYILSLT